MIISLELEPVVAAMGTIAAWHALPRDRMAFLDALAQRVQDVRTNDSALEVMLAAQCLTLEKIAQTLLAKARAELPAPDWQSYLRMGLEAQAQGRLTVETLHRIRARPKEGKTA